MSAYVVVDVEVTNPDAYEEYRRLAGASVEQHGGRYVARGGQTAVFEGGWSPRRLVILEFPSLDQARRWYESEEYDAAKRVRVGSATMQMVAVEGVG